MAAQYRHYSRVRRFVVLGLVVVALVAALAIQLRGAEETAVASASAADDYRAHIRRLRRLVRDKAPNSSFTFLVSEPFVVVGDESPKMVERRAKRTVAWAVRRLRESFFDRSPEQGITVWLFRNKASYRRHARAFFDDDPDTPYGYYSPSDRALVMNIATGGGTLVHEIVHPFIEVDFPDCPAWFNEGMGSLFEASSERDGRIVGTLNWRLPALQEALREGRGPKLADLMATSSSEFYGDDSGLHYAAARYLLYYLQEQGVLARYYKGFRAGVGRDASGVKTLLDVTGEESIAALEKRWRRFVLRLRYRR